MDYIYKRLPKDLAHIINDFAKDRTEYNKVLIEYKYTFRIIDLCWIDTYAPYRFGLEENTNLLMTTFKYNSTHLKPFNFKNSSKLIKLLLKNRILLAWRKW